jgi:hypothetical protein
MISKPFDRSVIHPLERPLSSDINQINSCLDRTLMDLILRTFSSRTSSSDERLSPLFGTLAGALGPAGFLADGFRCRAAGGMTLTLQPGLGFVYNPGDALIGIGGLNGVDDISPLHPIPLSEIQSITVPAADSTNPRIDIIEIIDFRRFEQPSSRDVIDPLTGVITPNSVNKVLSYYLDGHVGFVGANSPSTTGIGYKIGTPASSPAAPATTTSPSGNFTKIAEILVGAGVTSIAQNKIKDLRQLIFPGNVASFSGQVAFRVTGGNPSILSHDYTAPPGVVLIVGLGESNKITLWILAGNAAGSFTNPHAGASGSVIAASLQNAFTIGSAMGAPFFWVGLNSTTQTEIAAGFPSGIGVAVGQPLLAAQFPNSVLDADYSFSYSGSFSTLQAGG